MKGDFPSRREERLSFINALLPRLDPLPAPAPTPPPRRAPPCTAPMPASSPAATSPLPFLPPEALPANKRAPRTMPCPVMKRLVGETTPVGNDAITRAVAALPFPGSKAAVVEVPQLELVTYASLCAEMAVAPEQAEKIRQKYRVPSLIAHEALDAEWREQAARDPALREELLRRYREYVAWLRQRRAWR